MSKFEPAQSHNSMNSGRDLKKDHYYVQSLTEHIFLVRECFSAEGKPGPDDRIVRSFDVYYDAYSYASRLNDQVDKLDRATLPDSYTPSD